MRQYILELAQIDEMLSQLAKLLCHSIVVCETMVGKVLIDGVLDRVKASETPIIPKVFAFTLIGLKVNEVRLVLYHQLVQLVELLLRLLVIHLLLIVVCLEEEILLVGFEHACVLLFATEEECSGFKISAGWVVDVANATD